MATLSTRNRTFLKSLAKRNDMNAQGITQLLESQDASGVEQVDTITAPATASATAVHAAVFGDAVGPVSVTTGLTNPDFPRNVECAFGSTYDGGNVTVSGTNQFGVAITEVIVLSAGATVAGVKIFKTVTGFSYAGGGVGTHGTNTLSVGIGTKLGVSKVMFTDDLKVLVAGVLDAATVDKTNSAFTPSGSNLPNASKTFEAHYRVAAT